ncbi:MAG: DUF4870 domain-containing protein [Deltaproteobacteria bacterium]|nr:DUF4870 domain-containing protein [Deltaproteobacteria bacterium]
MADQNSVQNSSAGGSGLAPNVASLLCYLCSWVTGLIFILIEKNDKNVRFHAWQAIFFGGAVTALYIVGTVFTIILAFISSALASIFSLLMWLLMLGFMVLWVVLMVKAYQGERWKLPYLGDLAETQNNKS